jgi:hypothetical protein
MNYLSPKLFWLLSVSVLIVLVLTSIAYLGIGWSLRAVQWLIFKAVRRHRTDKPLGTSR